MVEVGKDLLDLITRDEVKSTISARDQLITWNDSAAASLAPPDDSKGRGSRTDLLDAD